MYMKIGYPCVNLSLECRSSKTFRLASYSDERLRDTVTSNLVCLSEILRWNVMHNLMFFRISSQLIPFASHPICTFPWRDYFKNEFKHIGSYIREHSIRISMHPDQFVLINSPTEKIFENSMRELIYHCEVLDVLGLDETHKVQIHVGGVYGDKKMSKKRFIERYHILPDLIKKRLAIENDDRLYSVKDCLEIHKETGIPIIYDNFHHFMLNNGETQREALMSVIQTWKKHDGIPLMDYSSQQNTARNGKHADTIDIKDFKTFLAQMNGMDVDIMLEIKDKEKSALAAGREIVLFNSSV